MQAGFIQAKRGEGRGQRGRSPPGREKGLSKRPEVAERTVHGARHGRVVKGGGSDGEGGVYTDKERQEQGLEHGEQAGPETGLCPDGSSKSEEGHLMNALDL